MKRFPLVSIVTPTFNQAEYLAETIESVLAQDYPNLEYIVLDDGSTDDTQEVLKRFQGRIICEHHQNMGQACTLNKGWEMAKGIYLGYLSSDDLLKPYAISNIVETLSNRADAVVAYCDFELIDEIGRAFRIIQTEDYDLDRLRQDLICQPGPGALFRREVFEKTGGWAEQLQQVPDFEFWLRAADYGIFIRTPKVLASFRVHEGSNSFSQVSHERRMEIVHTMERYWGKESSTDSKRSLATAHLIAAKGHAQSGKIGAALRDWVHAIHLRPRVLINISAWRMLASGLFRRAAFRIFRGRIKKK